MRPTSRLAAALGVALGLGAAPANAALIDFTVSMSGLNEVAPVVGDPDATGTAFLTFDDVANTVTWNITANNIDPVIAAHIHQGAANANGPVVIDFAGQLVGGPVFDLDVANVLANPSGYYVNVHTTAHTGGALRGQVPEPGTAMLLGAGLLGLAIARRRND